jgi:hypothetical protein
MNVYDIDQLKRDEGDGLFDLTKLTFRSVFEGVSYRSYAVKKGEEMRIDLVCQSIYGNVNNVDILLNVNNISNPLNIKEGSTIVFPDINSISQFRISVKVENQVQKKLANTAKSVTTDPNRQKYTDQNYTLPPTVLDRPTEQVKIEGNTIKIGTGLFNK